MKRIIKAWAWLTNTGRLYQVSFPSKFDSMENEWFGRHSSNNRETPVRITMTYDDGVKSKRKSKSRAPAAPRE